MTVAKAIFTQLYCRYLAMGECIVHDRGPEFCNDVATQLHDLFGTEVRIISAGKPCANGLIENTGNTFKSRARALMADAGILHCLTFKLFETEPYRKLGMILSSLR